MNRKSAYVIAIGAFLICIALILTGTYLNNSILTYTGVGLLFGGGFLFAVACMILIFVQAKKKADEMDKREQSPAQDKADAEYNRYDAAAGAFAYSIHGYRHASVKNKILTVLFLTLTFGSVFSGLICLFFKQFIAAYVLFGCFGLVLLIGLAAAIIATIKNK